MFRWLGSRRKLAVVAISIGIAGFVASMPNATAGSETLSVRADCRGVVTFTARSWHDGDQAANTRVGVSYSQNNGDFVPLAPYTADQMKSSTGVNYEFSKDNGYSFSDSFTLPEQSKPSAVTLKMRGFDKWGGTLDDDSAKSLTIDVPTSCTSGHDSSTTSTSTTVKDDHSANAKTSSTTTSSTTSSTSTVPSTTPGSAVLKAAAADCLTTATCGGASATGAQICKTGASGWSNTFTNASATPKTFQVILPAKTLDTLTVGAGANQTKSYRFADAGVAPGESAHVIVKADNVQLADLTVPNNCAIISADVTPACSTAAGSGAVLSMTNTGKVDEIFTVWRDGKDVSGSPFTVSPSAITVQKLLRLSEGESAHIVITAQESGVHVDKTVTLHCGVVPAALSKPQTQVLGLQVNAKALATTGIDLGPLAGGAILMIGVGVGLLTSNRKPRGAHFR